MVCCMSSLLWKFFCKIDLRILTISKWRFTVSVFIIAISLGLLPKLDKIRINITDKWKERKLRKATVLNDFRNCVTVSKELLPQIKEKSI